MNIALIIPTLNASAHWESLCDGISRQSLAPNDVLVIDSSSSDGTADRARDAGFRVIEIARSTFRHGGTRQTSALFMANADVLIYLTQDAVLRRSDSFRQLVAAFQNPAIGAAYGRQIPRANASAIEAHARLFNYHKVSHLRS